MVDEVRAEDRRKPTGFERVLGFVAPEAAYKRMVVRERMHEFAAVRRSGARGRPANAYEQGSSESQKKARERVDAMFEAREMEETFCIVAGLLQKLGIYIAGQLEYQPETGNSKADEEISAYFHDWCSRSDYAGRFRFRDQVQMAVQEAIRDGQHGFIEHVVGGELRLQAIEGDRIGNPLQSRAGDDLDLNGIVLNANGSVKHYEIYKRSKSAMYSKEGEVTPEDFIHLFFPNRSDQYHGVSKLAPALPHARDLYEMFGYEKIAAKFAASFAAFVRTSDMGAPGSGTWDDSGATNSGMPAKMAAQAGMVLKMEKGVEDMQFAPASNRPSGAFMAMVEALIREIALGVNLPYGFVYNMASFGGVTARLETEAAQRVFRWYQEKLEHIILNRVKRKVLLMGMASGKLKYYKDWEKGAWRYGPTLTGDVGHQVTADLDLVRSGAKTRSQLAAMYNNDFRQVIEKNGVEIKHAMDVSKRTGVPLELLLRDLENPTQLIAALDKAKRGESDEAPPQPGLIGTVGEKGVKPLIDLVMAVSKGEMDPEMAKITAMSVYGLPVEEAAVLFARFGDAGMASS